MYIKTATFLTKKKPPNSRLKSRECGGNYSKNKVHCSCPLCRFYGPAMQDLKRTEEMDYDSSTYEEDTIDLEVQDELLSDELRQLPLNYDFSEE